MTAGGRMVAAAAQRRHHRRRATRATLCMLATMLLLLPTAAWSAQAPGTVTRIDVEGPVEAALAVSALRFGSGEASWAVVARSDVFADALAGAPLSAGGPLLLSPPRRLSTAVKAELDRVLPKSGQPRYVYLIGGMSDSVRDDLIRAGYTVIPLAGPTRVETAVEIAREVRNHLYRNSVREVVLARASSPEGNPTAAWADAISGGAWATRMRIPVLITPTTELHPAVRDVLEEFAPTRIVLLGGDGAISRSVERAVRKWKPFRVSGPDRAATAADTVRLWAEDTTTTITSYLAVPGYATDGWAYGLAAAGLAADEKTPPLLVDRHSVPAPTLSVIRATCGATRPAVRIIGGTGAVELSVEETLRGAVQCQN